MRLATLLSSLLSCVVASDFNFQPDANYTGKGKVYLIERCKPETIHGCLDPAGHVVGDTTASCATFEVTSTQVSSQAGLCNYAPPAEGELYISIICSHESNRFMSEAGLEDVRLVHHLNGSVAKKTQDMDPLMSLASWMQMGMLSQWYVASPVPEVGQRAPVQLVAEASQASQKLGLYWEKQTVLCGRKCGPA